MLVFCPYCDQEISDEIHSEWANHYLEKYDHFKCPSCHKEMEIDVEQEPVFLTHEKAK